MQHKMLLPVVFEAGNSAELRMSSWCTMKPVIERYQCTNCLICWIYCPEPAIYRDPDGLVQIDYEHCKGCGICAEECPRKAIKMVVEHEQT
jgi:2-oxoacid:acceptor oxidoreductase delta subunit (pyruvate/2-ketoisovalerate family)